MNTNKLMLSLKCNDHNEANFRLLALNNSRIMDCNCKKYRLEGCHITNNHTVNETWIEDCKSSTGEQSINLETCTKVVKANLLLDALEQKNEALIPYLVNICKQDYVFEYIREQLKK